MHNKLFIVTLIFTTCTHAMETISFIGKTDNSLSLLFNQTKITVIKGSLSNAVNKADYIIVGDNQQKLLSGKFNDHHAVGTITEDNQLLFHYNNGSPVYGRSMSIYEKHHTDDSASDDDTYTPYPYGLNDNKKKIGESTYQQTASYIKNIEEPCISQSKDGYVYNAYRENINHHIYLIGYTLSTFTGEKAIREASNDLALCYREILRTLIGYYESTVHHVKQYTRPLSPKNINIVIPALSVDVGFPRDKATPIAIEAIFNFLQKYPNGFDTIYLVVEKQADFVLYKELLMEYYKPIKAIYLFRSAYFNNKDLFLELPSNRPQDVINYITWFMLNR